MKNTHRQGKSLIPIKMILAAIVIVMFLGYSGLAAERSILYDVAMDYIAENDWNMALYTLDKLQNDDSNPEESIPAAIWKLIIYQGLSNGDWEAGEMLAEAKDKAVGEDKNKFIKKVLELWNQAMESSDKMPETLRYVLDQCPPRKIILPFPKQYKFLYDKTKDSTESRLNMGLWPGDASVERLRTAKRSFHVLYTIEKWSGDDTAGKRFIEGDTVCELDLVKLYLALGRYFYNSGGTKGDLARRCLNEVLRLTESEPFSKERLEALQKLGL